MRHVDGQQRIPAAEILIVTAIIQAYIIEDEKTAGIPDIMAKSREQYQMQTMDQHLTDLYKAGTISLEIAMEAATNPGDFERALMFE